MSNNESPLDSFVSVSEYAELVGITPTHMHKIVSESDVKPVKVWGNTRIFARETLEALYEERSKVAKTIRSMGYVSPEVFKELEQRYFTSMAAAATEKAELDRLRAIVADKVDFQYETVANELEDVKAELTAAQVRILELTQSITDQNAVIVRATVENNDFATQNDELRALLAKASEKNDALIQENLSKEQRITQLKESQTPDADSEKLSDAYAEIQTLKGEIAAMQSATASV